MQYQVEGADVGKRIDVFLLDNLRLKYPFLTRNSILKLIDRVLVNDTPTKRGYKLKVGDTFKLNEEDTLHFLDQLKESREYIDKIEAQTSKLDIRYEDEDFLILNKSKGVLVHPTSVDRADTLANYVKGYLSAKGEFDELVDRAGVVHRLDKSVSGLIIFAKNKQAQEYLKDQFSQRKITKLYHAIVDEKSSIDNEVLNKEIDNFLENGIDEDWVKVEGYISRDRKNRKRMKFTRESVASSKYSLMYIKILSKEDILIKLVTGRMHQIRASLKPLGHTITGDTLYSSVSGKNPTSISLESIYIGFEDSSGKKISQRLV